MSQKSVRIGLCVISCILFPASLLRGEPVVLPLRGSDAAAADANAPTLTVYLPEAKTATGTAVVICPGGGYGNLAMDHEGRQVAAWLNSAGVAGCILKYRHHGTGAGFGHPAPLEDAQRAIRLVRSHADEWQIKPDRIGILGFSAGGHLASTAGTHFDAGKPDAADPVEKLSSRPDFMVLIYPVITMADPFTHAGSRKNLLGSAPSSELIENLSNERQVTRQTPPTFLVHTTEDKAVPPENSVQFYLALRKAGVPAEMHIYEKGPHGFGLGKAGQPHAQWPAACVAWMKNTGLLGPADAPAASGSSDAGDARWACYLTPLPKQLRHDGAFEAPTNQVRIEAAKTDEPLAAQAAKELREALKQQGEPSQASLTVRLSIEANDAELARLPSADQAYRIKAGEGGLALIGGGPRGLYYASKTLQQLIKAGLKADRVRIPKVTITDWPDMEDRGFWGGDSYEHLRWMSDHKLNYDEQISHCGVDDQKKCFVKLHGGKQKIIDEGPRYGINPVPVVLHLEQLANSGLFQAYPELQGKDAKEGAICYSNPKFVEVLTEWLLLWRAQPGVTDIDVWMAENLNGKKPCQCASCLKEDRSVLEARTIVAAYKKALTTDPKLKLRVLTSEETEKANPRVFAELPPEVKLWYYHSLFTYNTSHRPMIRPYLVNEIKKGRWVGVCPNLCAQVGSWQPFTGPQFVHARAAEFVGKGLSGMIGYAVPQLEMVRFNAEAAAEWLWNCKGRTPREFAYAFAVREGYRDPEKFAEWTELCGPVGWHIYGSEFPAGDKRGFPGAMAKLVKEGKLPELGHVLWDVYGIPFGEFATAEQIEKDVAAAARAVALAREMGMEVYIQESLVVEGYMQAIKALSELKKVARAEGVSEADKPAATRWLQSYVDSLEQARAALPAWELAMRPQRANPRETGKVVESLEQMIAAMKQTAGDLGCPLK